MNFAYEKPTTTEALSGLLEQAGSGAALLAGGTDLLGQIRGRLIEPQIVIDLKGIEELARIEHHDDGSLSFGATVVANRIIDDKRLQGSMAALPAACARIATFALRNRATVVGNIANASPCADSVPPLCVLDAEVELRAGTQTRRLSIPDFIRGVRATVRKKNEYVAAVHIPAQPQGVRSFFRKHQRVRGHDLALANAAVMHDPDRKRLRVAIGSCSPAPVVVDLDDLFESLDADAAADRCMKAIVPISDVRASAEYRTDMTGVLVRRLLSDLKA
ncbi:MAG: FAD binding domain-containing protein [Myxococcota bacterium]